MHGAAAHYVSENELEHLPHRLVARVVAKRDSQVIARAGAKLDNAAGEAIQVSALLFVLPMLLIVLVLLVLLLVLLVMLVVLYQLLSILYPLLFSLCT